MVDTINLAPEFAGLDTVSDLAAGTLSNVLGLALWGASRTPACASDVEATVLTGPVTANTGFFYARPQEPVRALLRRAIRIIEAGRTPLDGTDQGALNLALEETPAAVLSRHLLTCQEAQNGWV